MLAARTAGRTCFQGASNVRNYYSVVKASRRAHPSATIGHISGKIEHPYDVAPRNEGIDPEIVEWLEAPSLDHLARLLVEENIRAAERTPGASG